MIEINRHTLSNGLRIVHSEDNTTQMVALNILYDVGARDEDPEHTGFAHLFEHLMFGGSINVTMTRLYRMPVEKTTHGQTTISPITTSPFRAKMWKQVSG